MTTYYVSTTGSNSNSGTSLLAPKQTIQAGVDLLNSNGGDTLFIRGGTYAERALIDFINGANWSAVTTISPYASEPVLIRPPNAAESYSLFFSSCSYIQLYGDDFLKHLVIDGTNHGGSVIGLNSAGNHHIRIRGCEIRNIDAANGPFAGHAGQNRNGVTGGPPGSEFISCNIHHCVIGLYVAMGSAGDRLLIEECDVHHNYSNGIHRSCYGCYTGHSIIRNNRCYDNGQSGWQGISGIQYGHGIGVYYGDHSDTLVYNNRCFRNWTAGIDVNYGSYTATNPSVRVLLNTVYGNRGLDSNWAWLAGGIAASSQALPTTVMGNVSWNNDNRNIVNQSPGGTTQYNVDSQDPLFTDPDNGDFSVQVGSPAIELVPDLSSYGFNTDCFGYPRG